MKKLNLENFRVFDKETSFDLPPITIITGKNNAGKSTVLKALTLVADYVNSDNQLMLAFDGPFSHKHKINTFKNAKNWHNKSKKIKISYEHQGLINHFTFSGEENQAFATLEEYTAEIKEINESLILKRRSRAEFELKVSQRFVEYWTRSNEEETSEIDLDELKEEFNRLKEERNKLVHVSKEIKTSSREFLTIKTDIQRLERRLKLIEEKLERESGDLLKKDSIFNTIVNVEEEDDNNLIRLIRKALVKYFQEKRENTKSDFRYTSNVYAMSLFRFYDQFQSKFDFNVIHLSPNRFKQERLYQKNDLTSEVNIAINDYAAHPPRKTSPAYIFLKKWLKEFGIGEELDIVNVEGIASTVYIQKEGVPEPINLVDFGFGTGQVLTILLKITNAINKRQDHRIRRFGAKPILLIEEAESNLHPKVQSQMAELFYQAYDEFGLHFILETHSEYLTRKYQTMVADPEHKMHTNECIIFYIDDNSNKEIGFVKRIEIFQDGSLSENFGEGFYDVANARAMELYRFNKIKNTKA